VAESFDDDALRAAIAWRAIQFTAMGPWSAGTTAVLLADSAGNDGGAAGQTVYARGGPGALVAALQGAAREAGVEIRTEAPIARIATKNGKATGVVLQNGDEISARVVCSSVDPRLTFMKMMDPKELPADFVEDIERYKYRGSSGKVNIALDALPIFPAMKDPALMRGSIEVKSSVGEGTTFSIILPQP
jgi:phytoene dehydrogenase-like protein